MRYKPADLVHSTSDKSHLKLLSINVVVFEQKKTANACMTVVQV